MNHQCENGMAEVSVVMSVYNGAAHLEDSIRSVLDQQGVSLEFVIVDDGSTDNSADILRLFAASDARIVLIQQENKGLTESLIRGCAVAKGRLIARQDAGDLSLPGRLARQSEVLDSRPEVTLVSCWARFIGPLGEVLWNEARCDSPGEATAKMRADNLKELRGISCHSSAMFRKSDYIRAGGYRAQFRLAQDIDLWTRLTDFGQVAFVPEYLCVYRFEPASIGGRYAREQADLAKLIIAMRRCREAGQDEGSWLARAALICPDTHSIKRWRISRGYYFLGSVLLRRGDRHGLGYLRKAIANDPLNLKAWLTLAWQAIPASLFLWRRSSTNDIQ